jgi:glyoxylase-like metal-dependent hydrolase (beta-lactamase superfamily II)
MIEMTRRNLIVGTGVTGAALTLPSQAFAGTPMAGKHVPSFYRSKLGDFELTVVSDGARPIPLPPRFVLNVPNEEVLKAAEAAYMPKGTVFAPFNPVVVNTGSKLVLIDCGQGEAGYTQSRGAVGQLMTNVAAAGFKPEDFDTVIISHYHGDHINGLLKADNSIAFPNAEILVPANEHKFWMDEGEMSRASKGRVEGLFKNNRRVFSGDVLKRLRTYEWDKDVVPGILAVGTPGHSPGHTSHIVSSGNAKLYVQADVTHVPFLFVRNPGWHAFYDQDPAMAETTRRKVYDMLSAEKMLVQGFHYPFPSHGYVEKSGNGYRETMVLWNQSI